MKRSKAVIAPMVLLVSLSWTPVASGDDVAVYLANRAAASHGSLVRDLSDVLAASLVREQRLSLTGRARTEKAASDLGVDLREPLATETAVRLGESLGVGAVVAGLFAESCEIEAEAIDTQRATPLARITRRGERGVVFDLIDELGRELSQRLGTLDETGSTVAVLYFENLGAQEYDLFVRGMSDMLMTSLRQAQTLSLVERAQIDEGMAHFGLQPGRPLSPLEASTLGNWLGADVVITGRFGETYQIDASSFDVREKRLLAQRRVTGDRREIADRTGELGGELSRSLTVLDRTTRKIAVLHFENHSSETYDRFVHGLSDMLMTSLGQAEKLRVIERAQIDRAMANFRLELSGPIDAQTAVEVGQWLGADAVVLGSFSQFGEAYRIDARLIDAATGELVVAQNVRGAESDVITMVDRLGAQLIDSVGEKEVAFDGGTGFLRIRFMITRAEMTERLVYHHICRLIVDGKHRATSPVVRQTGEWITLFTEELRAGKHDIEVIHGFVREDNWDGEHPEQPKIFPVTIEPGATATLQYSFGVGWFRDAYYYEPPWRGATR